MDPSKRTARKHLYKVTRIGSWQGQSCVLFESSTVCSSSSEFKALKHQDVLKVSQGFNRLNLFTYQYGSKRGTHGPTRRIKVCICVLNHWGQSFSAIPESKWTGSSKHWQAPMLFPQMQHADALFLWRCFKCSAFTGLNWTRIYDLSWHERLKLMGNKPTRNRTSASVPQRQWNCAGSSDSASGQTWIKSFGN